MSKEKYVTMIARCDFCGKKVELKLTVESVNEFFSPNRRNIQDVFPYLSAEERELLLSHTCNECWEKMFSFEDEDEEDEEFLSQFDEYKFNDSVSCEEMKGVLMHLFFFDLFSDQCYNEIFS